MLHDTISDKNNLHIKFRETVLITTKYISISKEQKCKPKKYWWHGHKTKLTSRWPGMTSSRLLARLVSIFSKSLWMPSRTVSMFCSDRIHPWSSTCMQYTSSSSLSSAQTNSYYTISRLQKSRLWRKTDEMTKNHPWGKNIDPDEIRRNFT